MEWKWMNFGNGNQIELNWINNQLFHFDSFGMASPLLFCSLQQVLCLTPRLDGHSIASDCNGNGIGTSIAMEWIRCLIDWMLVYSISFAVVLCVPFDWDARMFASLYVSGNAMGALCPCLCIFLRALALALNCGALACTWGRRKKANSRRMENEHGLTSASLRIACVGYELCRCMSSSV
jgi:hypothetical protein